MNKKLFYAIIPHIEGKCVENVNFILHEWQVKSESLSELLEFFYDNLRVLDDKQDGDFIIPWRFYDIDYVSVKVRGGNAIRRVAENCNWTSMLPLDIDGGLTLEQAKSRWGKYSFIAYSSFNNSSDIPKFRLLLPLKFNTKRDLFVRKRKAIKEWIGDGVDETCLSVSRGFYLPAVNRKRPNDFFLFMNEGELLDLEEFETEEIPKFIPPTEPVDGELLIRVCATLKTTRIDSYNRWWQMVQALKSEGLSLNQVAEITAGNILHASPSTGVKSYSLLVGIYNHCTVQSGGVGKLIKLIRDAGGDVLTEAQKERRDMYRRLKELRRLSV